MADSVEIYTDGACQGNPGPGGWGAILVCKGIEKEISGYTPNTTNNRMEITAVIEALKCLKRPCEVTITSDSKYLCDSINRNWAISWRRRNWVKSEGSPTVKYSIDASEFNTDSVLYSMYSNPWGDMYDEEIDDDDDLLPF